MDPAWPVWTEGDEGASLTLELDAVDAERRDARDVAAFVGKIRMPADDSAVPGSRGTSFRDVGLVIGGFVFGGILADVVLSASFALGFHPSPWFGVAVFGVGAMLPGATVLGSEARKRAARTGPVEDRFTLTLDASGLSVRGRKRDEQRFALGHLHAVEGGRRLVAVLADGTRLELPCDLGDRGRHDEIAARFTDMLGRLRAHGGGYRGPRVATAEPVEPEEEAPLTPRRAAR